MEALARRIEATLLERFPGSKVEVEWASGTHIGGEIVWSGFDGMDQIDRQTRLWSVLRSELSEEERDLVTLIYTFTPAEDLVLSEG